MTDAFERHTTLKHFTRISTKHTQFILGVNLTTHTTRWNGIPTMNGIDELLSDTLLIFSNICYDKMLKFQ